MQVQTVTTRSERREFIFFPEHLYRGDPGWVPPLWRDELKAYSKKNNPILANSDFRLHLARDGGRVVGRNLVYVDQAFVTFTHQKIGFFGAFECIRDAEVARALLGQAEQWLRRQGMQFIRGPIHPVAECWGFLLEGYNSRPVFMAPYNPPWYHDFLHAAGYRKVKDLLAYEGHTQDAYTLPERFHAFQENMRKRRPNFTLRRINPRSLLTDAEHIWRISNAALQNNWGYVPVSREVMLDLVAKLKPVLDPDAVWFVEDAGTPVGYCLGFPDLNVLLKRIRGRLFPLGFLKLLLGVRKLNQYRLFALAVLPRYHNLGLDALLYTQLNTCFKDRRVRIEANYILEDNYHIRNALEKLNLTLVKKYRIYEKPLTGESPGRPPE